MVAACSVSVPNDVSETTTLQNRADFEVRRSVLRGDPIAAVAAEEAAAAQAATASSVRPPPALVAAAEDRPARARPSLPRWLAGLRQPARPTAPTGDQTTTRAVNALAASESYSAVPAQGQAAVPPRSTASNPGISDEQEFDAVAARETIESDAERRARMQADRVEIEPTALPERPRGAGPSIITYALSTSHQVGERRHSRNPLGRARSAENCAAFRSADLAQEWFLGNGGPTRDRRGLDPDGDGFACGWDPSPYRNAVLAARN